MANVKAKGKFIRSSSYFERVRKFWKKVTFLFKIRYLKSKTKSNQAITKYSKQTAKNDILHLNTGNNLNKFNIPRVIKENNFLLDFFQFSICCQNLISNNTNVYSKSNILDIVQNNFNGKHNFKELFCFAVLINQSLTISKPFRMFSMVTSNISDKRALKLRKIYIACMKDVDKYLKLLSCNNVNANYSFDSKVLISPKDDACKEKWNINECFRRINMLASLASSNQLNKKIVKARVKYESEQIFDQKFTNIFGHESIVERDGNIYNTLRFEDHRNVCDHDPEFLRYKLQECVSEQRVVPDRKHSVNQRKSCLRLLSKYGENDKIIDNLPKYTSSYRNADFVHSENGKGTRSKLKHNICHKGAKPEKESEDNINVKYPGNSYLILPSNFMMPLVSTSTKSTGVRDSTKNCSNSPISKDFTSANNSIMKCNITNNNIKAENKSTLSQTKDTSTKTRKKRKFRTSLKLDDVERVFNLIEPRYRSLENSNCSINYEFDSTDQPNRIHKNGNHERIIVNEETGMYNQGTTSDYQKSDLYTKATIMNDEKMTVVGKQRHVNHQYNTVVDRESHIKPEGQAIIIDEPEKVINTQETFVNPQVATVEHKQLDTDDSTENVDGQVIIMDSYLTIMAEKEMKAQIKVDCRVTTKGQKLNMDGEEINTIDRVSNDVKLININDDGETSSNDQEKNKNFQEKISENQATTASDQDIDMGSYKINMVDQESYGKYGVTIVNDQEMIKNGEVSFLNYNGKKRNSEKTIWENIEKNEDDERATEDNKNPNIHAHEKNSCNRKMIKVTQQTTMKYETKIGDRRLHRNNHERADDSNMTNQEKRENEQNIILSDQETSVADQKINNLICKRKRNRRPAIKIEFIKDIKPQREAKLKAALLLKRVRRNMKNPPSSI